MGKKSPLRKVANNCPVEILEIGPSRALEVRALTRSDSASDSDSDGDSDSSVRSGSVCRKFGVFAFCTFFVF